MSHKYYWKIIPIKIFFQKPKKKLEFQWNQELGLGIDEPLEKFKNQITSDQKPWDTLSKQLNTLYIYNMHKNPDIASKWKNKREALVKWIEGKRKENLDFGK